MMMNQVSFDMYLHHTDNIEITVLYYQTYQLRTVHMLIVPVMESYNHRYKVCIVMLLVDHYMYQGHMVSKKVDLVHWYNNLRYTVYILIDLTE